MLVCLNRELMSSFTGVGLRGLVSGRIQWSTGNIVLQTILQISEATVHRSYQPIGLMSISRYSCNIKNYRFVNVNVSKMTSITKGVVRKLAQNIRLSPKLLLFYQDYFLDPPMKSDKKITFSDQISSYWMDKKLP